MELTIEHEGRITPRVLLGRRLRRLRESEGLSQRGLAEIIGYPHTYISRVERGEQLPSQALAVMFDTHFNSDDLFQELLDLAHDNMIAEYSRSFVEQEKDAVRIQVFTSSSIPGLLQIEEYTRECFRLDPTAEATNELDARVTARMSRQRLFNGDSPPHYWAIIDETALKRPTASRDTMRAQLDHLLKMAEKPHISIQVLPFSQALHPMLGGSLTLLTLRNGSTVALVESFASGEPVESPQKVLELVERFDIGRSKALPASESLKLIRSYLKGYADEPCQHS